MTSPPITVLRMRIANALRRGLYSTLVPFISTVIVLFYSYNYTGLRSLTKFMVLATPIIYVLYKVSLLVSNRNTIIIIIISIYTNNYYTMLAKTTPILRMMARRAKVPTEVTAAEKIVMVLLYMLHVIIPRRACAARLQYIVVLRVCLRLFLQRGGL